MILTILGGVGLFLLGMTLLTDGLKNLGGETLKKALSTFTGGTLRGILTGAGLTALVQASSATSIATIGFVSAGLITLKQGITIIFGANLGTTSTGWMVSLLGLKYSIASLAMPMVGVGAVMRLFSNDRVQAMGTMFAGFSLIFIGIDVLQTGLGSFSEAVNPSQFPDNTIWGRFLLLLIGIVMTVVLQSSSVAVAMTMTALHAGSINLDQAAAMVIGQNVGTTITTSFAAIGATIPAKRTALAHIMFNLITGALAFIILPFFTKSVLWVNHLFDLDEPALLLASFHTGFNVLGVIVLVPFLSSFTKLISTVIKDDSIRLTRHLDQAVGTVPAVGLESARLTVVDIFHGISGEMMQLVAEENGINKKEILQEQERFHVALEETRVFLSKVKLGAGTQSDNERYVAVLHAIDHLDSVIDDLAKTDHIKGLKTNPHLNYLLDETRAQFPDLLCWLETAQPKTYRLELEKFAQKTAKYRKEHRLTLLELTAKGELSPDEVQDMIETLRWIDGIWYHFWRAVFHLETQGNIKI
ncbi:Na/Pi cotransporter family protein [bacterium]|nr:MAG: Na/Pi cotransporter family protein [bacterium]